MECLGGFVIGISLASIVWSWIANREHRKVMALADSAIANGEVWMNAARDWNAIAEGKVQFGNGKVVYPNGTESRGIAMQVRMMPRCNGGEFWGELFETSEAADAAKEGE